MAFFLFLEYYNFHLFFDGDFRWNEASTAKLLILVVNKWTSVDSTK